MAANEHDYASRRQRRRRIESQDDDDFESPSFRVGRNQSTHWRRVAARPTNGTTDNLATVSNPNTDHNYVIHPSPSTLSQVEEDLFEDENDDDANTESAGGLTSSDSATLEPETDNSVQSDSTVSSLTTINSATSSNHTTSSSSSSSNNSNQQPTNERLEGPFNEIMDIIRYLHEPRSPPPPPEQSTASNVINLTSPNTPSPCKKRKRLSLDPDGKSATPKVNATENAADEDDGLTCPICLDNWEMSGEHRLASLKCGHLFGDSCIRRWLQESARQSGNRVCPQCKTKANPKDLRYLYAKRLRAIDRSEEHRMREQLSDERVKCQKLELELATMKMSYAQVTQRLKTLENDNDSLKTLLRNGGGYSYSTGVGSGNAANPAQPLKLYKLFMERNVELSRKPGCRVMVYSEHNSALIVSQNSTQGLFPGYGIRFIDVASFKPSIFLHTSLKLLRDLCLSSDQQLLVAASMESTAKIFDLRTRQVTSTLTPGDKPLWACAMDCNSSREHNIYLGSQHGSIYMYDTRFPENIVNEYFSEADLSPVIGIAAVPADDKFPNGGFLVCKLISLWFYEYTSQLAHPTRLCLEGRFTSMNYDVVQRTLLVQSRNCGTYPQARNILGKLNKINGIPVIDVKVTFFGSTHNPVMVRSTQIAVESNTLVAAYLQESKLLSLYDAHRERQVQSLPVQDVVYDTCPLYIKDTTYLAALTETKCRLYKLTGT